MNPFMEQARIRNSNRQRGMTMIELMVASFIAVIFMLAAGTGYLVNQKAYRANREKLELQQTASHVMEIMEKDIRAAASATISGSPPSTIRLFGLDGSEYSRFNLQGAINQTKIYDTNALLAPQKALVTFIPNLDTTTVQVNFTLEDVNFNKVAIRASASLRNHPKMRNAD